MIPHGDQAEAVMLHIFIKGIQTGDTIQLRGIIYAMGIKEEHFDKAGGAGELSSHPAAIHWQPVVRLVGLLNRQQWSCTAASNFPFREKDREGNDRLLMPIRFNFTFESDEDAFELHVDNWNRFVYLSKIEFVKALHHPPKPVLMGIVPPISASPKQAAVIASHNAEYHLKLGMAMIYVYANNALYNSYLENPVLSKLQSEKKIVLVMWKNVPECIGHTKCNKIMVWSHMLLGLWGTGQHVLLTDVDEFLTLPPSSTIDEFMDKCVGNSAEARLWRYNIVCEACTGESDDFLLWTTPESNPLKQYSSITEVHRLVSGKSVVYAEFVHGFAIHSGYRLEGVVRDVPTNCSRILHIENMFGKRIPHGVWNESFVEWQWIL